MSRSAVSDLLGQVVGGRYLLTESLGEGTAGRVFVADDLQEHLTVAVKIVHPTLVRERGALRLLRADARAIGRLSHQNVLGYSDSGEDSESAWFVSPLMAGSLRRALEEGRRLDVAQAAHLGAQVLRGLEHAHAHGVVHRGVSPGNLLWDARGRACVGDFGVARAVAASSSRGSLVGSTRYLAPEQIAGGPVGPPADVYSLALCLLEALTGEHPFEEGLDHVETRTSRSLPVPSGLEGLGEVLQACGSLDAEARPSAGEAAARLERVASALGSGDVLCRLVLGPTGSSTMPGSRPANPEPSTATLERPDLGSGGEAAAYHDPHVRPGRGSRLAAVVVTILLGVLLVGGGAAAWLATRVDSHTVPDLVGLPETDARERVEDFGWIVERLESRRDGTKPGEIIDQEPEPGDELREGGVLRLFVSLGPTLAPPPQDLVGLQLEDARRRLAEAGFEIGDVERRFDEEAPEGTVVEVEDLPDELPKGSAVDVVVSDGPRPRTIPADLLGLPEREAVETVEKLGLRVEVVRKPSEDVPEGRVAGVDPAPGSTVERGSVVELTVSSGPPLVAVPDVRGLVASAASEELEAQGFVVEGTVGPPNRKVVRTDPPVGEKVRKGSPVTLYTE